MGDVASYPDGEVRRPIADAIRLIDMQMRSRASKWNPTRNDKYFMWCVASFSLSAVVSAIVSNIIYRDVLVIVSYVCMFIAQISSIVFSIASSFVMMREAKNPSQVMLDPILDNMTVDADLVDKVCSYSLDDILFSVERIELGVKHARSRISMLVGSIESVGLIPAVLTLAVAVAKISGEHYRFIDSDFLLWSAVAVTMLYVISFIGIISCHRLGLVEIHRELMTAAAR